MAKKARVNAQKKSIIEQPQSRFPRLAKEIDRSANAIEDALFRIRNLKVWV